MYAAPMSGDPGANDQHVDVAVERARKGRPSQRMGGHEVSSALNYNTINVIVLKQ